MPVVGRLFQDFPERLEFRGSGPCAPGDEPRVAADLPQAQELGECGEPEGIFSRAGGLQVEELALGLLLEGAVEPGLVGLKGAPYDLLDPGRQLWGHDELRAP